MTDDLRVWCMFPTANPERCRETIRRWSERGYLCIAYIDDGVHRAEYHPDYPGALDDRMRALILAPDDGAPYPGYYNACNRLVRWMYRENVYHYEPPACIVFIGDDMLPDPGRTAQQIAAEMIEHFGDHAGVMQPCGDPQGDLIDGLHNAARICGSPWVNRAWIDGAFGGHGPMPPYPFRHFYGDQALKDYSEKAGALWMRPDLTQFHLHHSFGHSRITEYQKNNQAYWNTDKAVYEEFASCVLPRVSPGVFPL